MWYIYLSVHTHTPEVTHGGMTLSALLPNNTSLTVPGGRLFEPGWPVSSWDLSPSEALAL